MIHQLIFAGPKPGLPADAFQSYWMYFHARDYAARIPQIRQYLVAPRIHIGYPREAPFYEGAAEIWLNDETEQLASLQSSEYLLGCRPDEPRWAAFWQTFVHDADSVVLREYQGPVSDFCKLYVFLKRRAVTDLAEFRSCLTSTHASTVGELPSLARHLAGFARQSLYGFGEPRFDAIEVWSFSGLESLQAALASEAMRRVEQSWGALAVEKDIFTFVGREHWIIRPGER